MRSSSLKQGVRDTLREAYSKRTSSPFFGRTSTGIQNTLWLSLCFRVGSKLLRKLEEDLGRFDENE